MTLAGKVRDGYGRASRRKRICWRATMVAGQRSDEFGRGPADEVQTPTRQRWPASRATTVAAEEAFAP